MRRRPRPPVFSEGEVPPSFIPAPDLAEWVVASFIANGAPLENGDHRHLKDARFGMLWATLPNSRHMVSIVGQAELPLFQGGKWSKARQEQQLEAWFGALPDFLLTFDAGYAAVCDDGSFCALVEHELYHCGQALNRFGQPKFTKSGQPVFAIRGHDVEEFVGIVQRYGAGRGAGHTFDLVEAAKKRPTITEAQIVGACGTCRGQL
jgi:hypothetical protein